MLHWLSNLVHNLASQSPTAYLKTKPLDVVVVAVTQQHQVKQNSSKVYIFRVFDPRLKLIGVS